MKKISLLLLLLVWVTGCRSIPPAERETARNTINFQGEETLQRMAGNDPEFKKKLEDSVGYFVGRLSSTDLLLLGKGRGIGVLVDKRNETRTYLNADRTNIGPGVGAGKFSLVILFSDEEVLENFKKGIRKNGIGLESLFNKAGADLHSLSGKGYSIYMPSEIGVAASAGLRSIRLSVNEDLNPSPVSKRSIPNIVFNEGTPTNSPARKWEYKMPFLAQQVIDEGYDLPLPYGIGITYAHVRQDFGMDNLFVGLNGGPSEEYDWVSFHNAETVSDTVQLQLDCWIFPFMNIFGTVGYMEGNATLDVKLDLGQSIGIITLPIDTDFSGTTYGLGTILAGGWNNWFFVLPLNATYAAMDETLTKGLAYTATPRAGYTFNIGRWGDLSPFAGVNYLRADITITNEETLPIGNGLEINYKVDQSNADHWNAVVGFNWDFSKHLAWAVEYNGFIGSREAIITLITWRL